MRARRMVKTEQMPRTKISRRRRAAKASILASVTGSRVPRIHQLLATSVIAHFTLFATTFQPANEPHPLRAQAVTLQQPRPLAEDPLRGEQREDRQEPAPALPERRVALEDALAAQGVEL